MTTGNETATAKPRARRSKNTDETLPAATDAPAPAAPSAASATPMPAGAPAAALPTAAGPAVPTKSSTVVKLLLRSRGATVMEVIAATDWQPHSVRAFLSGLRKKGRVLVRNERKGGGFAYYMQAAVPAPADLPLQADAGDTPVGGAA